MNEKQENIFKCHRISGGFAHGKALLSKDDINFYLIDPDTGVMLEKGHSLEGRSIAGKILVFPGGKGSSVVQTDGLYQLAMRDNAPTAMIIENADTVLVATAIIMEVPMVDDVDTIFYEMIEDGSSLVVNAEKGEVIIKK